MATRPRPRRPGPALLESRPSESPGSVSGVMGGTGRPPAAAGEARNVQPPSPPAEQAEGDGDISAGEVDIKIEPEEWQAALEQSPPCSPEQDGMHLGLGERLEDPMVMVPRGDLLRARLLGGRRRAEARTRSADDDGFSSDGDASMLDGDQFIDDPGPDEELTSLSWLQDKNLIKGIPLKAPLAPGTLNCEGQIKQEPSVEQGSADEAEEDPDSSLRKDRRVPYAPSCFFRVRHYLKHSTNGYDPKIHAAYKPPYSFSCMIFMAIEDSRYKALPVREIYTWIEQHFPFYQSAAVGWKNSVRHNLSLSKCFKRADAPPPPWGSSRPKGSYWMVEPESRASMIYGLQRMANGDGRWRRSPKIGKIKQVNNASDRSDHKYNSTFLRRQKVAVSGGGEGGDHGPNPQLFPFLAARLLAAPGRSPANGAYSQPLPPNCKLLTPANFDQGYQRVREGKYLPEPPANAVDNAHRAAVFPPVMIISRSAAEDHTYACCHAADREGHSGSSEDSGDDSESDQSDQPLQKLRGRLGDSLPSSGRSGELTPEEVEGADLLLNLAGISRSQSPQPVPAEPPRRRPGRPRGRGRPR
ncbi:forkhead box protein N3-like isoform X1 [Amphibalanus amphitrite]|uniref:forkhead box protein N3-like isoform X1 n=1 Tax=Amphibalanus amphitrite TaxID=1232801 RepID=UPI001C912F0F|nr:forkhead box protein N3-like isoform X1 [Amphibalanus amphitrite]